MDLLKSTMTRRNFLKLSAAVAGAAVTLPPPPDGIEEVLVAPEPIPEVLVAPEPIPEVVEVWFKINDKPVPVYDLHLEERYWASSLRAMDGSIVPATHRIEEPSTEIVFRTVRPELLREALRSQAAHSWQLTYGCFQYSGRFWGCTANVNHDGVEMEVTLTGGPVGRVWLAH